MLVDNYQSITVNTRMSMAPGQCIDTEREQ
jgi:hypothetical protein